MKNDQTFIFQLDDRKLIFSKDSLIFSENQNILKEYKLINNYQANKLTLDQSNNLLYVVNSQLDQVDSRCEVFDMKKSQSKSIQKCPYSARGNGVTYAKESVYSIGGYAGHMSKDIFQYVCIENQWIKLEDLLQPESHVIQSLFIKELDSILFFDQYQYFNGTALYDFKKVINHGPNFPVRSGGFYPNFQPLLNKKKVFSYAINYDFYDLCGYDIRKREWKEVLKV